jgi:malate dehydrogenase (oxaloacetate-decarboxylating)
MSAKSPSPAYSIRIRVRLADRPGTLGHLAVAIGEAGGNINALEGFELKTAYLTEDVIVYCESEAHQQEVLAAVEGVEGAEVLEWEDRTFALHTSGKIQVDDLAMAYSPGVARVCSAIAADRELSHEYTIRKNTVAVVSDGTAVLGLGDIGPHAAMPVMEGKAQLFKRFGGVDAFPICLDTKDPDEIVSIVTALAPTFGGINLEDIAAPGAFDIEARLVEALDIPVFHDDQHGTAIVTVAGLENALKIVGKQHGNLKIVVAGVGAAGVAVSKMLMAAGVDNIIGVDRRGAVHTGREDLNASKQWFAENTNPEKLAGTISDVIRPARTCSSGCPGPTCSPSTTSSRWRRTRSCSPWPTPNPEIRPELIQDIAAVIATGRSDFPNQINNVLAFPGIFRGALDAGRHEDHREHEARRRARHRGRGRRRVAPAVAEAVHAAAVADGVCRPARRTP